VQFLIEKLFYGFQATIQGDRELFVQSGTQQTIIIKY
jgi:hypothetical protein